MLALLYCHGGGARIGLAWSQMKLPLQQKDLPLSSNAFNPCNIPPAICFLTKKPPLHNLGGRKNLKGLLHQLWETSKISSKMNLGSNIFGVEQRDFLETLGEKQAGFFIAELYNLTAEIYEFTSDSRRYIPLPSLLAF